VIIMPASPRSFLIGLFTAALALTPTIRAAQKSDTGAASELSALTGQLRIGTEFFLNRTETKENVERHFRLMRETGITLVRVFIIWDDIERTPNNWNFEGYDWIYDAAAENGIKIVATLCAEDPPGWVKKTPFYHNRTNLNDSVVRTHAAAYIQKVVNRYEHHPAQGVWLLANEPTKYDTEPATLQAFGEWLKAKYGTVDELNKHWFEPLDSFSDVTIRPDQLEDYWTDYHRVIDWREFNTDNLINVLFWTKGQIEALDAKHPTHINVTEPTGGPYGQDVFKEERIVDILGASIHPAWIFPRTSPTSEYGERFAYRLDIIGGPAGDQPWWVTELQSGPTIFTGGFPLNPTPADMTRWLWDAYGAGAKAVIFWLWHPRVVGSEAGEWGLVSLDGTPSNRVPAVKAVFDGLERNADLAQAQPQTPKVAILYNREASILMSLDDRTQKRGDEVEESLMACYMALRRAHISTRFVDIDQLRSGALGSYAVLYIPYSYAMDDEAVAALRTYVSNGGTLWADGLVTWKNDTGEIRPTIPGSLTDVFGIEASDIYPVKTGEPYSVTAQNEKGGELWKLPLALKGAEVILRDREGKPFATRHHFGKGQAIYYEAAVTLAYSKRNNPVVQQWIVDPAVWVQSWLPVQMVKGAATVGFRGLINKAGPAAILTNWGEADSVTVRFQGNYAVADTFTKVPVEVTHQAGATLATVKLPAGGVTVLRTSKGK
jgi:beta-galactosidase